MQTLHFEILSKRPRLNLQAETKLWLINANTLVWKSEGGRQLSQLVKSFGFSPQSFDKMSPEWVDGKIHHAYL